MPLRKSKADPTSCPPKPALQKRPLITPGQALELTAIFKVLANDTRLRLVHALSRSREMCVTDLAETVAMKPQGVSNQLQRLADRGILRTRRDGNHIYYRIVDPCVTSLLHTAWCLAEDAQTRKA